jgi:hypothetical protein
VCSSPLRGLSGEGIPGHIYTNRLYITLTSPFVYFEPFQAVLSFYNFLPKILSISLLPYLIPVKPVLFYHCSNKVHAIKAYRGVEVYLHLFITSAPDGTGWLDYNTGRFVPGNYPFVPVE